MLCLGDMKKSPSFKSVKFQRNSGILFYYKNLIITSDLSKDEYITVKNIFRLNVCSSLLMYCPNFQNIKVECVVPCFQGTKSGQDNSFNTTRKRKAFNMDFHFSIHTFISLANCGMFHRKFLSICF